ncbi:hypothetical protein RCL1_003606 [Eukaryota sp. TZLM3-RCL]
MSSFKCLHKNCGASFSDYTFVKNIGSGAQGGTSLRRDKEGRLFCFKKSFVNENDTIPEAHFMFNDLDSPFLVKIHHCFIGEGEMIQMMDYCAGGSLADLIASKVPLSKDDIMMILTQLAHGLKFLHSKGIIHRDIKPENIVLTSRERPFRLKICDFGISKILHSSYAASMLGTVKYMAPEMLNEQPYTSAVDMWALGVLLYFLIKKEHPFNTFEEIKHGQGPNLQFEFGDLIARLLVRNVSQRMTAFDVVQIPKISELYEEYFRECTVEEVIDMKRDVKWLKTTVQHQSNLIEELKTTIGTLSKTVNDQQMTITNTVNQMKVIKPCQGSHIASSSTSNNEASLITQLIAALQNLSRPQAPVSESRSVVTVAERAPVLSSFSLEKNPSLFLHIKNVLGVDELTESLLSAIEKLKFEKNMFIHSLDGIQALTNLKELQFEHDALSYFQNVDLSPLISLNQLKSLYIPVSGDSLHAIGNILSLEHLELIGNDSIKDLIPLSNLIGLSCLKLMNFLKIKDIYPLATLSSLKSLEFTPSTVSFSLSPLANLALLEELCVTVRKVDYGYRGFSTVATTTIRRLIILSDEKLKSIDFVSKMKALEVFEISNCSQLTDLSPLNSVPSLSVIKVDRCGEVGTISLESIPLTKLHIGSCRKFSFLSLKSLKKAFDLNINITYCGRSPSVTCQDCQVSMTNLSSFESIVLKNSTNFEHFDFSKCSNLKNLTIENVQTRIQTDLVLPSSITSLHITDLTIRSLIFSSNFQVSSCSLTNCSFVTLDGSAVSTMQCLGIKSEETSRIAADISLPNNINNLYITNLNIGSLLFFPKSKVSHCSVTNCSFTNLDFSTLSEIDMLIIKSLSRVTTDISLPQRVNVLDITDLNIGSLLFSPKSKVSTCSLTDCSFNTLDCSSITEMKQINLINLKTSLPNPVILPDNLQSLTLLKFSAKLTTSNLLQLNTLAVDVVDYLADFTHLRSLKYVKLDPSPSLKNFDLSPISNLPNLEQLELLSSHTIRDIRPLTTLCNLKRLTYHYSTTQLPGWAPPSKEQWCPEHSRVLREFLPNVRIYPQESRT